MRQTLYSILLIFIFLAVGSYFYTKQVDAKIQEKDQEIQAQLQEIVRSNGILQGKLDNAQVQLEQSEVIRSKAVSDRAAANLRIASKEKTIGLLSIEKTVLSEALAREIESRKDLTQDEIEMKIEDNLASLYPERGVPFFIGYQTDENTAQMIHDSSLELIFNRPQIELAYDQIETYGQIITDNKEVIHTYVQENEALAGDKIVLDEALSAALAAKTEEERGRVLAEEQVGLLKTKWAFDFFRPKITVNAVSLTAWDPVQRQPSLGIFTIGIGWAF